MASERPNPQPDDVTTRGGDTSLPPDETEVDASLTSTDASTDPVSAHETSRAIESDPALSPVAEQQGGASISGLPNRRQHDWGN